MRSLLPSEIPKYVFLYGFAKHESSDEFLSFDGQEGFVQGSQGNYLIVSLVKSIGKYYKKLYRIHVRQCRAYQYKTNTVINLDFGAPEIKRSIFNAT